MPRPGESTRRARSTDLRCGGRATRHRIDPTVSNAARDSRAVAGSRPRAAGGAAIFGSTRSGRKACC
ncbi:MAG: hypothetical protein MZW92_23790 [Comamonadaceae bacterium]|nr:hypothetical protein [Comamonadaceae bacterium]